MIKSLKSLVLGCSVLFFMSCTSFTDQLSGDEKLKVVTTLNPVSNIIKYIAQDKVTNYNLTFNSNSHSFEPTSQDIINIEESDAVFYIGLGMDDSVLDFSSNADKFVRVSDNVKLLQSDDEHVHSHVHVEDEENHDHSEEHAHEEDNHDHSEEHAHEEDNHVQNEQEDDIIYDPHIWLSLNNFKLMSKNVLDKLVELDPENRNFYEENYGHLVTRADSIYSTYEANFASLINRKFVSNHAAYRYLAQDFDLINLSIYDINNHGEVNPRDLSEIIDVLKSENIKLLVGDKNNSNKELEVISSEVNIPLKLINNLEKEGDYFTGYEEILSVLFDGLK